MSFNFFPINYKPEHSMNETKIYISDYIHLLNAYILQKLNGVYIQPPFLSKTDESWNAHQPNERYISFDNKYTSEVNEVINNPSNYMRYALINFPNMDAPLFTSMPSIRRDVQEKSGEVMVNFNYYIEYRLINEVNPTEQILPLLKNVLMMINGINRHEKFKAFRSPNYITDKVNFITISELHKKYPTLALNDALNRYVVANGLTFVSGVYQPLVNGKRLLIGSPTTDDYSNSGILYDFNEITSTVISLIKVSIRPSHELIKKQIIIDLPNELEKQIYQKTALNQKINFVPSIGIQIYFSHLMLINLKKMHLCEVVHSPCSIALSKYFADNEIEVM